MQCNWNIVVNFNFLGRDGDLIDAGDEETLGGWGLSI